MEKKKEFNNLTNTEMTILNNIKRKDVRIKLMKIYAKMKKHSQNGKVNRTIDDIIKLLNYVHSISRSSMYRSLKVLREIGLLTSDTKDYYLTLHFKNNTKNNTKSDTTKKPTESIDTTSLEESEKKRKYKYINNTIYSYNTTDVVAPVEMVLKAEELLKDLNIKSKIVKKMVIDKLKTCKNINRAGFINYIIKVISEKKAIQEQRRNTYKANYVSGCNAFNDFEQRQYTAKDYKDLENALLGWN